MKTIGVLLGGSGYLDGTEITEAIHTLTAIDACGASALIISIDSSQYHTVNHSTGEPEESNRNVFDEANRIARGKCIELSQVDLNDLNALIIPGGFGVAKNFCEFAFKGATASVSPKIKNLILDIHQQKKPIGALCIAPALLALVLGEQKPKLTIGSDLDVASELEKLGAKHLITEVTEIAIDEKLKIASTAAYMFNDAKRSEIFQGISKCVQQIVKWA
jgi:enhancing lycopene biosynthesis protein 2